MITSGTTIQRRSLKRLMPASAFHPPDIGKVSWQVRNIVPQGSRAFKPQSYGADYRSCRKTRFGATVNLTGTIRPIIPTLKSCHASDIAMNITA
jgi:hypothetical protein